MARYDGFADWYDEWAHGTAKEWTQRVRDCVRELLGAGTGKLLDLGCGGGGQIPFLQELGRTVTGVDVSDDQLRVARRRASPLRTGHEHVNVELVQADASALPFSDATFDAVASLVTHTDLDDYPGAITEVARVLRPGGVLVHVGLHPCFLGHFSEPVAGGRLLRPGYRDTELSYEGWSDEGIRVRVGARHVPMDDLVNTVLDASLTVERLLESEGEPPSLLAFRARR